MRLGVNPEVTYRVPIWRACLCLLLILLVAYNPFALANGRCGNLSCEKMARHRATIGSGELQHFSPVSNPGIQENADVVMLCAQVVPSVQHRRPFQDEPRIFVKETVLLAGVWFRPPPSA
jgi:hypothetical protein